VKAIVEAQLNLNEPTVASGLVTWFQARVVDEEGESVIVRARAARIHVGLASDVGKPLAAILSADSAELAALYGVYFEEDWVRQQVTEGAGSDLFYLSEVVVAAGWSGRNVELALVRQLCDTVAQGCELAVICVASEPEATPWLRLGFTQTTDEGSRRLLHLSLGYRQARVVPAEGGRSFRVVPNPPPGSEPH